MPDPEEPEPIPVLPPEFSPQGSIATFDGVAIGYLTDFDWQGGAGEVVEVTDVNATVVGVGENARVVKRYDCTSIEPLVLNLQFWGPPSFSQDDAGMKAELSFTFPGGGLVGEAILTAFNHNGTAGKWTTGTASFQLTGADYGS